MIVLTMIVKNEAYGIARTLESVRDHIDGWLILDTGSTDGTQDIIRETMRRVEGALVEEPFVDFSTTRNRALYLAEAAYGAGAWCLMLSGNAIVERPDSLRALVCLANDVQADAIDLNILHGGLIYPQPVLSRAGSCCAYRGVTHETLIVPDGRRRSAQDIFFAPAWVRYDGPEEDRTARWRLDVDLLEADRKKRHDPRTTFYLAQSYECLGHYEKAAELYTERLAEDGYWEERFISSLRIGRCYWRLGRPTAEIITAFERAHALCPERAEPLNELAKYLAELGAPVTAHGVAAKAAAKPFPSRSSLFVERWVYETDARERLANLERLQP